MTYRDDRDVLRQRVHELEQELAEANKRLAARESESGKAERLKAELATAQESIERVRRELYESRGNDFGPGASRLMPPLFLGAFTLIAGMSMLRSTHPRSHAPSPQPVWMQGRAPHVTPPEPRRPVVVVQEVDEADDADEADEADEMASLTRAGRVVTVSGAAPVSAGDVCLVSVEAARSGASNCRVNVRCGERVLYGNDSTGYAQCAVEDREVTKATDEKPTSEDGDAVLALDLAKARVEVREEGSSPFAVVVDLAPSRQAGSRKP